MKTANLTVEEFMTWCPHCIGVEQPLSFAHDLMRRHNIRHLPVLSAGKLVGALSQRDLHLIESLKDVDPLKVSVEEAMAPFPYSVQKTTALAEVIAEMESKKYGCAIVMDKDKVIGLFTTIDALTVLRKLLARGESNAPHVGAH